MSHLRAVLASLVLVAGASTARAGVTVVDPQGGPGFALLQAAIDSAASGDVLLLRPGSYYEPGAFYDSAGKGLTIEPDVGVGRLELSPMRLIGAGTRVLRGLDIGRVDGADVAIGLGLQHWGANLWLEDCRVFGPAGHEQAGSQISIPGRDAALLDAQSGNVVRCSFVGGAGMDQDPSGFPYSSAGGRGVFFSQGHFAIHECSVTGGRAGDGVNQALFASKGGTGFDANAFDLGFPTVLLSGCTIVGGAEGEGPVGGQSGSGLVSTKATKVRVRDSSFAAGAVNGAGTSGTAFNVTTPLLQFAAPAKSLVISPLLRGGDTGTLHLAGAQGDMVLIAAGTAPVWLSANIKQGVLAFDPSTVGTPVQLGVLTDPSGELDVSFSMPSLPAGFEDLFIIAQAAYAQAGSVTLGSPSLLLWLAD